MLELTFAVGVRRAAFEPPAHVTFYLVSGHVRQLVWNSFGSWLRTVRPGIPPSELVVATALRQRLPEFLLNADQNNFTKFVVERQDTKKMAAFHLAA